MLVMRVGSFKTQSVFQTVIVSLATILSLVVFGVMLAYWTWIWVLPPSGAHARVFVSADSRIDAAYGLFGITQQNPATMGSVSTDSLLNGSAIRLLGIVSATTDAASTGRRGYALVQLNASETIAVHEGENLSPGLRLAEVANDHLILERGGIRQTLTWLEKPVVKN